MAKMPELVKLHKKLEEQGLVVIGVNFDENIDKAKKLITDKELAWPQVHALSAAKGRDDLWERIAGISGLPRVLLIDRAGVLHGDIYPSDLEQHVTSLLSKSLDAMDGVTGDARATKELTGVRKGPGQSSPDASGGGEFEIVGEWDLKIAPEGMPPMEATLLLKRKGESLEGELPDLGGDLKQVSWDKEVGQLKFTVEPEEGLSISFELTRDGVRLVGRAAASDGITGEATATRNSPETETESLQYKPTQIPKDVHELFLEDGNLESETVLLIVQGGPMPELVQWPFFDEWKKTCHLVAVHQAQTLNRTLWTDGVTYEESMFETAISIEMIERVAKHFRERKKTVLVYGASYGAFLLVEYLDEKQNLFDGIGIVAGRVDMPEDMWVATKAGRYAEFDLSGGQQSVRVSDKELGLAVHGYLLAGLGHQRYSQNLAKTDLSSVVYMYGGKDSTVGPLLPAEVEFLKSRGAEVLKESDCGHDDVISPEKVSVVIRELLNRLAQ